MTKLQKFLRTANIAAVSALFGLFSAVSSATVITNLSNNPLSFTWAYSSPAGDLTGNGTLTLSGFNTTQLIIDVYLENTSLLPTNRLTAFGFGIDPNATSVAFSEIDSTTGMIDASLNDAHSIKLVEVCAFGGSNCDGGANGGIYGGGNDSFRLTLLNELITTTEVIKYNPQNKPIGTETITTRTPQLWGNSVDIAPIGFKYQTGKGSFEFYSSSSGGSTGTTGQTIPEPGILGLLGIGLVGQALLIRQRRRRLQN